MLSADFHRNEITLADKARTGERARFVAMLRQANATYDRLPNKRKREGWFEEKLDWLVNEALDNPEGYVTLEFSCASIEINPTAVFKANEKLQSIQAYVSVYLCSTCHGLNPRKPFHVEVVYGKA